ncbi:MAG: hypothetical protein ACREI7_00765 [Myxococcota bacterium]
MTRILQRFLLAHGPVVGLLQPRRAFLQREELALALEARGFLALVDVGAHEVHLLPRSLDLAARLLQLTSLDLGLLTQLTLELLLRTKRFGPNLLELHALDIGLLHQVALEPFMLGAELGTHCHLTFLDLDTRLFAERALAGVHLGFGLPAKGLVPFLELRARLVAKRILARLHLGLDLVPQVLGPGMRLFDRAAGAPRCFFGRRAVGGRRLESRFRSA